MASRPVRSPATADITRGIREFVSRDWDLARRRKDRYWADRIERFGIEEAFRIADQLRRHALTLDPGWPHPDQRQADLDAHARLAERFERASLAGRH